MVLYNTTIDDSSPILSYIGGWNAAAESDGNRANYEEETLHSTNVNGSSVLLRFNGVSIYVYGTRGSDHGQYTVSLDDLESQIDGFSETTQFKSLLYNATGLASDKEHSLRITNSFTDSARSSLAIDYFEVLTGRNDDVLNELYDIDDTNSTITYSPADAWTASTISTSTVHTSTTDGSTMIIPFSGNAAYLYGSIGAFGILDISVDGANATVADCAAPVYKPGTLLFIASDLASGEHQLNIRLTATEGRGAEIDYLRVSRWSDNNGLGDNLAKTPIIAGTICGVTIVIAWLVYLFLWWRKKQRRNQEEHERKIMAAIAPDAVGESPKEDTPTRPPLTQTVTSPPVSVMSVPLVANPKSTAPNAA